MPRAIRRLRRQEILQAFAIDIVAGGHTGLVQRVQGDAGRIGVGGHRRQLAPASVRALQGLQPADGARDRRAIRT